jgi:putative ABC transport system permease protein
MGKTRLVGRLVVKDLRRRPGSALLLVLAITAATATLTLGLVLHGVASHPFQQTRALTRGPDVVANIGGPAPGPAGGPHGPGPSVADQVKTLTRAPGVTGYSGPYPVASAVVGFRGLAAEVEAEGRAESPASVEQPAVTAGTWVRPGGVVFERTFAEALRVGVGDRVTLNGRPYRVAGIAVTAAEPPYPNMCYPPGGDCAPLSVNGKQLPGPGLAWVTELAARSLASAQAPLSYYLNLRLADPASAPAFAARYGASANGPTLTPWQDIEITDGQLVLDEQQVLSPGALLAALLAIASVAVLAGGRMIEHTRRIGRLKAVGGTPGLVSSVLLAENLILAAAAAVAGLAIGWLAAPAITNPGAGLVGTPGAPSLTLRIAGEVLAVALAVALAATLAPAIRAARTSTVSALADAARRPRRHGTLIRLSRRLPVPLLFGMRLVARRPRRALLSTASVAVTAMGIVAVLVLHTTVDLRTASYGAAGALGNPVVDRDEQMMSVLTVVLVTLTVLNAVFAAWATVLDARPASALARALGATPQQVSAGIATAQALPAVPGALLGIPLGIGLVAVAAQGIGIVVPPAWWLAAAVLGTVGSVGLLAAIPAQMGAWQPVTEVLQAETA